MKNDTAEPPCPCHDPIVKIVPQEATEARPDGEGVPRCLRCGGCKRTDHPDDNDSSAQCVGFTCGCPPESQPRMDAYYYGFDATGVRAVDEILSAVAAAGKMYHGTDQWTDVTEWAPVSPVEMIQQAANRAAESFRRAAPPLDAHEKCEQRLIELSRQFSRTWQRTHYYKRMRYYARQADEARERIRQLESAVPPLDARALAEEIASEVLWHDNDDTKTCAGWYCRTCGGYQTCQRKDHIRKVHECDCSVKERIAVGCDIIRAAIERAGRRG